MKEVSTREAARKFFRLLDDAAAAPVMITRRGRPRAVIMSARDFSIVQKLLARERGAASADMLDAAIERVARGEHRKAIHLKDAALLLGGVLK